MFRLSERVVIEWMRVGERVVERVVREGVVD